MNRIDRVEHDGIVVGISDSSVSVEIVSKSACASCHAKSVCAVGDSAVKIIEVPLSIGTLAADCKVGESVKVVLDSSLGVNAVWLAYVAPMAVLLASILVFSSVGMRDLYTGLLSIGVVALYYLVLSFFRKRLDRIFTFSIEPINK
ncbi:MAG: SoxR reducing system RseC family protein [Bacteroidales bacterium]|nr:SoxR reducing system RseC family protein [Candidatus Cacconaster scatequi]